jgi:retinol-binding protein 3
MCELPARTSALVFLALALILGAAPARAQATMLPETPVGLAAREWLDAFNSGDSVRLGAYYRKYYLERSMEAQMARRAATGGFDLVSIERSEPRHLEFVVKERNSSTTALGVLDLGSGDTVRMTTAALVAIAPGVSVADFKIDAATRARVIDSVIAKLEQSYVFPEVAKKMGDALRVRAKRGEYNAVTNGLSFASLLTQHLRDVSHDRHLGVDFSAARFPVMQAAPDPDQQARMRQRMESMNCGFVRAEQLAGNVGYLKFNFFADPDICGPTASAAMNFLANVDALIIDLRDNGGGAPKMVAYVSSYLFSQRTHLNDLWTRRTNATDEYWTSDVPGKRFGGDKPVYVLTSRRTFSGAEEFSYNLKNLKRATLVGETTGGGAHPVNGQRIDDHFIIGVPFARAINPISKTNWEGTGVEPDVKVPASDALTTAQKLIADKRGARVTIP